MYVLGRQVDRFVKYTFLVDRSTGLLYVRFWSTGRQVCYMCSFHCFNIGGQVDRFVKCACFSPTDFDFYMYITGRHAAFKL